MRPKERIRQSVQFAWEEVTFTAAWLKHLASKEGRAPKQRIVANGSPKTGTTWMVRLLTCIPGYRSVGHFRGNPMLLGTVAPGDVVHDHAFFGEERLELIHDLQLKIILMIRDPRDQAVSRMFHIRRDTTHAWHDNFQRLSNEEALLACIEGRPAGPGLHMLPGAAAMTRLSYSWLDGCPDLIKLTRYEDLLRDPVHELGTILAWLGIKADRQFVQAVVSRNRFERLVVGKRFWKRARKPGQMNPSSHFRKGIARDWKNYFSEVHEVRINELVGQVIEEWGYAVPPNGEGDEIGHPVSKS